MLKNVNSKVFSRGRNPSIISMFDQLPERCFLINNDNKGQLYKEAITYLYDENIKLTNRVNGLEQHLFKLVSLCLFSYLPGL